MITLSLNLFINILNNTLYCTLLVKSEDKMLNSVCGGVLFWPEFRIISFQSWHALNLVKYGKKITVGFLAVKNVKEDLFLW